ncbi:cation efflux protein [Penicillium manginii]|uniref:cation efflux protein n=1 Tax=Penicillium manginii TaxID=203109 RepID=UPI0025481885|nr:cation efflux protein [Penicillium manginii]KAJ5750111.1 cation efflux protein [Penicillium manginii]
MTFKITRVQRLSAVIAISMCFFTAEISVGLYTHSLALIADAFHYLNDLIGFIIALVAALVAEKRTPPKSLTFGWQRAQLLGAFFNGVLLFGLGISIFLQSIERFATLELIEKPKLVLIMGCIGLGLNIINILFLHDHDHDHGHGGDDEHGHHHDHGTHQNGEHEDGHISSIHMKDEKHVSHKHNANASAGSKVSGRDLAMMGVLIHVMGDAGNNIGVIIAALVIWLTHYGGRYYADPAVSMGISLIIFASSIPLIKRAGTILLQSAPEGVEIDDVTHDIEQIPGVLAVHELHIWRLDQKKSLASAHIVLSDKDYIDFKLLAKTINECFHAYGVHSVTLQPELVESGRSPASETLSNGTVRVTVGQPGNEDGNNVEAHKIKCQLFCGSLCADLSCCR